MSQSRPVNALAIEGFDRLAECIDAVLHSNPIDGEGVIRPSDDTRLVQPGEDDLSGQAVVVAHPLARRREAEEPIEEDRDAHVGGQNDAGLLKRPRLPEGRQVTPQFLEAIHPEGHPLLDHEGIEGKVPMAVGPIVHQVPEDEGLLRQVLIGQQ